MTAQAAANQPGRASPAVRKCCRSGGNGSPLGLDHTVTVGIISAIERPMQIGDREYPNLLQTDAAINRGNSGGPLINLKGDVIGMNTAVSQSSQGIGFAISADVLRDTLSRLLNIRI